MGPVSANIRRGNVTISAAQLFGSSDSDDLELPVQKKQCQELVNTSSSAYQLNTDGETNPAKPLGASARPNRGPLDNELAQNRTGLQWSSSPSWHELSVRQLSRGYHTEPRPESHEVLKKSVYFINSDDLSPDDMLNEPSGPPEEAGPEEVVQFTQLDRFNSQVAKEESLQRHSFEKSLEGTNATGDEVDDEDQPEPPVLQAVVPREIFLSEEQQYVRDLVVRQKKSIFFTGAAGTGKSVLLRRIISDLRRKSHDPSKVAVTASTGIAAFNIGGSTVHRFAGIGLGKEDRDVLLKRVRSNRTVKQRWQSINTLIIDEISMVPSELLDKLDYIARKIRRQPNKPFGGIQVIFTGDFFQLPPVISGGAPLGNNFAFDAECWKECIERTIVLKQVFRQKDSRFSSMLDEMRRGILTPETVSIFKSLDRPPNAPPGVVPTQLFARRYEVERSNVAALKELKGTLHTYQCIDEFNDEVPFKISLDDLIVPPKISLKIGAQVMMVKNIDEKLVNGSIGKVIGFMDEATFALYDMDEMSEDPELFDPTVMGAHAECDGAEDAVLKRKRAKARFLNQMSKNAQGQKLPVVEFRNLDGTSRTILVSPETWTVEDAEGKWLARRTQVPLILAWALSIHKSQGQTLDYAMVDLGNIFERGQAYVALSRVTRLEGLQVKRFDPKRVTVHERVLEFYDSLEEIQAAELKKPGLYKYFNAFDPRTETVIKPDDSGTVKQHEGAINDHSVELDTFAYSPALHPEEFGNNFSDDSDFDIDQLRSAHETDQNKFNYRSSGFERELQHF